jgi:hypothetical protein
MILEEIWVYIYDLYGYNFYQKENESSFPRK